MKYLYLFLSTIIISASSVFAGSKLDNCPNECQTLVTCIYKLNIVGKYSIFPPNDTKTPGLGTCFCSDVQSYFNCLDCTSRFDTKGNSYNLSKVQAGCDALNGNSGTAAGNTGTGAAGNTGAAGATGAAGTAGTANTGANGGAAAGTTAGATTAANTNTGATGVKGTTNSSANTNNTTTNSQSTTDNKENGNKKSGNGGKIGVAVIAAVAAIAVIGFFVYTRKQKERPESMPFFGNSASSPNQYATLGNTKEMTDISTSNLTTDYNTQFYPNVDTTNNNQYNYNNTGGFEQPPQNDFNNQYDSSYQGYNNQYPASSYENEIAGVPATTVGTIVTSTESAHYESRRESMMPGSQPTSTNFSGAYVCAYKYDPQLDDELELQVNDQVQIIEEYEDGWMKAINLTTGKEGMAPRVCIREA